MRERDNDIERWFVSEQFVDNIFKSTRGHLSAHI